MTSPTLEHEAVKYSLRQYSRTAPAVDHRRHDTTRHYSISYQSSRFSIMYLGIEDAAQNHSSEYGIGFRKNLSCIEIQETEEKQPNIKQVSK